MAAGSLVGASQRNRSQGVAPFLEGEAESRLAVDSGRDPLVVMVKPATLGDFDDDTTICRMNLPAFRAVHVQRLMRPPPAVVAVVVGEDPPEVPLAEHDGVIQALVLPPRPDAGEPGPEQAVGGSQARPGAVPLVSRELVPECEDLHLQGEPGTEEAVDEGQKGA